MSRNIAAIIATVLLSSTALANDVAPTPVSGTPTPVSGTPTTTSGTATKTTPGTTTTVAPVGSKTVIAATVKSYDATKKSLVVVVEGKDVTLNTTNSQIDGNLKVGSMVDVTYLNDHASIIHVK